ncbi:GNAT family N-acetyltransferase [Pseudoxanthomonas sp. PXM01]|uniref:GNAT family N-acetyltransferase n=1 Tax=Pseudoxanthomonas sp. PXM01 TaxID=2769295 RepID=UPI00177F4B3F|nr:GNAT family N-acetyltransferase [Pseudoxanthomonas sp. PXM01]MBD9467764.1 GNAT family N-acetyltransferase [Pseudoxanthomonas sp. PXM01]
MERNQAEQIANLLNTQNQLTVHYGADRVLACQDNYLVRLDSSGRVIACAELKKVQWYQFELLHVTVSQQHHRQGHARSLITEATDRAISDGARILQSTIRAGNIASEHLFRSSGFEPVSRFYNARSKNIIGVWQRVLSEVPPSH